MLICLLFFTSSVTEAAADGVADAGEIDVDDDDDVDAIDVDADDASGSNANSLRGTRNLANANHENLP